MLYFLKHVKCANSPLIAILLFILQQLGGSQQRFGMSTLSLASINCDCANRTCQPTQFLSFISSQRVVTTKHCSHYSVIFPTTSLMIMNVYSTLCQYCVCS